MSISFLKQLFYADGSGTPRYNGNISSIKWKDRSRTIRGYKFTYDDANRLTQAAYGQGSNITSSTVKFTEGVQYDAHGNVTGITRYGKTSSSTYGLMDNLTLSYSGNQLTGVTEATADYDFAGSFEYKRTNGSQYIYDRNGSLIADKSRGIAYITYDTNGNPSRIYFTNGNVTKYVYSAAGEKLRVEYRVAVPNITVAIGSVRELAPAEILSADSTDYLLGGSLTLRNGRIDKLQFEEGYCQAERYAGNSSQDDFFCYYYDRDHLGNIRQVVKADRTTNGTVVQTMEYYPFGAQFCHSSTASEVQSRKYNGKVFIK